MVDLLLIGVLFLVGALVAMAIKPGERALAYLSLALPLGLATTTFSLFLISLLGIAITIVSFGLTIGLLSLISLTLIRRFGRKQSIWQKDKSESQRGWLASILPWLGGLLLVIILLGAAIIGVGRGYSSYDAAAGWSIKGYGIAIERQVEAADQWGTWGKAYPLNQPMSIGLFQMVSGDLNMASKLIFPLVLASLLLAAVWYWQRRGIPTYLALLGVIFLATVQLVFYHATIGYANLLFSSYLVLASLWVLKALGGGGRDWLMAGFLLMGACWTRAEGIAYVLALLVGLTPPVLVFSRARISAGKVVLLILPIAIVWPIWFVFARSGIQTSHLGTALSGVMPSLLQGQLNLFQLYLIPRLFLQRALSPDNLGYYIPVSAALLTYGLLFRRAWRDLENGYLLLVGVIYSLIPIGLFYVRSFTRINDFQELLIRSFDRAVLPALFIVFIAGMVYAFGPEWRAKEQT